MGKLDGYASAEYQTRNDTTSYYNKRICHNAQNYIVFKFLSKNYFIV